MRLVGAARARELLYFSDKFDAAQALNWGLVTRVFDADMLFTATLDAAATLAGYPAEALRAMKTNILSAEELASGPELREGFAAFRARQQGDAPGPT